MTDPATEAMKEVWAWKREAEKATEGMSTTQLIEFYRRQAEDTERRMGLQLRTRNASDTTPTRG